MNSIRAVYENGVFKPTEPVNLPEHCPVTVEPLQEKTSEDESLDSEEFWREKSIDQLAEEQGIGPVADWGALFGAGRDLWKSDEEFERFLNGN